LMDKIWEDRPKLPSGKVFIHDTKYSGIDVSEKLKVIRKSMVGKNADYYLVSSLDDIAWMFNIRGNDIDFNPVVISYALITKDRVTLFIENKDTEKDEKISNDVTEYLTKNNIEIKEYNDIEKGLHILNNKKSIYFDPSK